MEISIVISALVGYSVTLWTINEGEHTSVVAWLSWCILDALILVPSLTRGDNPTILIAYTAGSFFVAVYSLWKTRRIEFGKVERLSLFLGATSFILSQTTSPDVSLWCSTACMTIAGVPLLSHVYKCESQSMQATFGVMAFLFCACLGVALAITSGSSLVFPVSSLAYTLMWTVLMLRKCDFGL